MKKSRITSTLAAAILATGLAGGALASDYEVTITNLTSGQTFTPMLVVSHKRNKMLFEPGEAASPEIEAVAEGGDTMPLQMMLEASPMVHDLASTGGLLGPGESVTVTLDARKRFRRFSLIGMLLPSNDGMVVLDSLLAPREKWQTASSYLYAWDAGTEMNDELCAHIPGPTCGGEGHSAAGGEGFIHIHPGIHGEGDLSARTHGWNNPVARVTIRRMD